jgi:uncharacterized membrane protein YbhN (UPF0104 family)
MPQTRNLVSRILPGKVQEFLQGSTNALRIIGKNGKRNLFSVIALTSVRICIYGIGFWVSLWGLQVVIPIGYAILAMAMAQFTTLIPISIMGLGPVEAVCVFALSQIAVEPDSVMAALLVTRFIALFWLCVFFFLFNINRGPKLA